jgi:acyl-CoA synthetase (AMP-forming)/AMP-acid ligase II
MNIAEILREQADRRPDAPAIIDRCRGKDRITTFAGLERQSQHAAALFRKNGLRPGDAVLVFYPMSAELYVVLLGLFRLGVVAMFVDPSAGRDHIERCCEHWPPRGLIAGFKGHLLRLISPALRRVPRKFVLGWPAVGANALSAVSCLPPYAQVVDCSAATPALLTFTTGSTGLPKAAVRSHGFLTTQHRILDRSLELRAGNVDLATLPIVLLANLASGVTSVIPDADLRFPGSVAAAPIFRQIEVHQVTTCTASPAFFERLAQAAIIDGKTFPRLRRLYTGGGPVYPRVMEQMQQIAPQARVFALYGSTEAEPIAHVERDQLGPAERQAVLEGKGLPAGRPVPEITLAIIPDQWGRPIGPFDPETFAGLRLPAGHAGEIAVAGEHVLTGYLKGRGDEETKFRVGEVIWHRTGDAGYLDELGRLWLLGRCAAKIEDSRGVIYPLAAESAAYADPAVKRAAAVSISGRRLLIVECFEDMPMPAVDKLHAAVAHADIDEVRVVRRIPVDGRHNAKIDYAALRRLLCQK